MTDDTQAKTIKALRQALSNVLSIASEMEEEFAHLGYEDCIDSKYVDDLRHEAFAVGVGERKDIDAAIARAEAKVNVDREWASRAAFWDGTPFTIDQIKRCKEDLAKSEALLAKLKGLIE